MPEEKKGVQPLLEHKDTNQEKAPVEDSKIEENKVAT